MQRERCCCLPSYVTDRWEQSPFSDPLINQLHLRQLLPVLLTPFLPQLHPGASEFMAAGMTSSKTPAVQLPISLQYLLKIPGRPGQALRFTVSIISVCPGEQNIS